VAKTKLPAPWVQTKNGPRKLYLSYGSNLCIKAMRQRCPDASPVLNKKGKPKHHMLSNAKLVFRGVADIDFCPGSRAPVGLWWISERDEAALDRFEGYPQSYQKFHIWMDAAKTRQGLIYLMSDRKGIHPPLDYYFATLETGYRNFGIDRSYLEDAVVHSYNEKNPSKQTIARRERQRKSSHPKLVPLPESVQIARIEAARDKAEQERKAARLRLEINQPAEELSW
jgi:hypothetical protein